MHIYKLVKIHVLLVEYELLLLLEVELELPVYQVRLDRLCIALIRPNH